jgi:hypothetical protein
MAKLFISHASDDIPLVEAFVELLESGVGVPAAKIFCSSIKGQNIKPGQDFKNALQKSLGNATCVIALISEAYYGSTFCLCELGATWALEKDLIPVLIPPIDRSQARATLSGLQQLKIDDASDLDELRDELIRRLELSESESTPRWNRKRKKFTDDLPELLARVAYRGAVPRSTFEALEGQLREYKAAGAAQEKELAEKDALIAELKKAKDQKDVKKIVSKHSTARDQFKAVVSAALTALKPLPRQAREALYYEARRERYVPKSDDWDDAQQAAEDGYLIIDTDENTATPKDDNRKIGNARHALRELERWLGSAPREFVDDYSDTEGEPPDITLRSFWRRHL